MRSNNYVDKSCLIFTVGLGAIYRRVFSPHQVLTDHIATSDFRMSPIDVT
jgi:hypothetical protein